MAAGVPLAPRLVKELDFKVIKEEWLTIKLEDGSTIKFKTVLLKVFETDAKDPMTDEPVSAYEGNNVVTVRSPENLKGSPSNHIPPTFEALKMPNEEVEVIETIDPNWNLYELENGKRIKSKPVITKVSKINDVFDRHGNPYYVVNSQMVVGSSKLQYLATEASAESLGEKYYSFPRFVRTFFSIEPNISFIYLRQIKPFPMKEPSAIARILDPKTGIHIDILDISKYTEFLDKTEGILTELNEKLESEGIDTPDLVKRVWKTSE